MKALSVLVVDDDRDFAEGLGDLIRFYGHEVHQVCSAERALEAVTSSSYDLIFLDIRMPGQSGLEVYPKLREISPRACIVFSTAFIDDVDRRSNRHVMHAELLEKPSGINRLESVLRRVSGEFELVIVGSEDTTREVHQALRHRGYQILRAASLQACMDIVTRAEGEKVAAVVGETQLPDGTLHDLVKQLGNVGMALPTVCLNDDTGIVPCTGGSGHVQSLAPGAALTDILDAVDRGAELFQDNVE